MAKLNQQLNQLNLTVVALVALVAIVGLVALVLNAASLSTLAENVADVELATGGEIAFAEPTGPADPGAKVVSGSAFAWSD